MDLANFHFLRPLWLLTLIPGALIITSALRRSDPLQAWRELVDPALLEALLLRESTRTGRLRPVYLLALVWCLTALALAGPAWQQEAAPFAQDQAAVVIALEMSEEMEALDVAPSRRERSVQKIHDFLALSPGRKTALIAYAGTPHLAMPLTTDEAIIETFAKALVPGVMPEPGNNAAAAIELAQHRLDAAAVPGAILLITGGIDPDQVDAFAAHRKNGGAAVHILAVAGRPNETPSRDGPPALPLDEETIQRAARAAGGSYAVVSADSSDVTRLNDKLGHSIRSAPDQDGLQWRDEGYWLVPILALLLLLFFRPGGAVVLQ